jgi:hypothetical protein
VPASSAISYTWQTARTFCNPQILLKSQKFNDQLACRISFDDLHLYGDMKKSDIMARLYSDISITPKSSNPPKKNQLEIYDVAKLKDDYQIELGQIWFLNDHVYYVFKYFKTFKGNDYSKAIRFFFDLLSKTSIEFGSDAITKIYKDGNNDSDYKLSVRFYKPTQTFHKEIVFEVLRSGSFFYIKENLIAGAYSN